MAAFNELSYLDTAFAQRGRKSAPILERGLPFMVILISYITPKTQKLQWIGVRTDFRQGQTKEWRVILPSWDPDRRQMSS
jgi:hypothetical protein